jgi:hypothetical protein
MLQTSSHTSILFPEGAYFYMSDMCFSFSFWHAFLEVLVYLASQGVYLYVRAMHFFRIPCILQ